MAEGKKILLAEDDEMISSMYKTKLEQDGFVVLAALNGADALELAKKEQPDLVLLDVIMPQMDGFSVLEALMKDNKTEDLQVIMLTNLGTDEDQKKGAELGAKDYWVKADLTPSQISEKIEAIFTK